MKSNGNTAYILILLVFIISLAAFIFWKLGVTPSSAISQMLKKNESAPSVFKTVTPPRPSTVFTPAPDSSVFTIKSINKENKSLTLAFVWPDEQKGTIVNNSSITCKKGDIKIYTEITEAGPGSEETVSIESLFSKLQELDLGMMAFSGVCRDTSCTEIFSSCRLFVYSEDQL